MEHGYGDFVFQEKLHFLFNILIPTGLGGEVLERVVNVKEGGSQEEIPNDLRSPHRGEPNNAKDVKLILI